MTRIPFRWTASPRRIKSKKTEALRMRSLRYTIFLRLCESEGRGAVISLCISFSQLLTIARNTSA